MTAPNQPAPTWMALLGLGAFQIGGTGGGSGLSSYGQGIDESFVNDLIYGPLAPKNLAANSGAVSDLIPVMQQMISGVPIAVLKYLQPFIPGATDADFADSPTAAAFIVGTFIPKLIIETTNGINRLVKDLEILFDVFHVTYPAGAPTDPAGQTSWFAAWNDLLALIGISTGTTPTSPAPTIGSAITSAGTAGTNGSSWSTRLTNDLLILLDVFHLTYTVTQWNAAWTDLLALFGIVNSVTAPTNPTPTIGPAITSAQATANTGVTNAGTAQTTANTGVTNAATAQTKANTASTWATRLTNNLLVLSDMFHLTYAAGSVSDPPGTLSGGKPTWYSCWNDLLSLTGTVNAVTAPTDTAPTTGTVIQANTATANTASTNASIAISNASAANTLAQGTVDGLYQAFNGGATTGNPVSTVKAGAIAIPASNIIGATGAAVTFGAVGTGNDSTTASSTSKTLSETHSIISTDLGVLVFVSYFAVSAGGRTWSTTVTYGGVAMTQVGAPLISGATAGGFSMYQEVWWLKSPPTGSKTVTATVTGTAGSGNIGTLLLNSVSYLASKVASINGYSGGGGATLSMTGTSVAGNMLVGALSLWSTTTGTTLTGFNQTSRWLQVDGTYAQAMQIGDAAGATSVTFSATNNHPTPSGWVGYIVELSN